MSLGWTTLRTRVKPGPEGCGEVIGQHPRRGIAGANGDMDRACDSGEDAVVGQEAIADAEARCAQLVDTHLDADQIAMA